MKLSHLNTVVGTWLAGWCLMASAGSLEQAERIHNRLAGVPPTSETRAEMASMIDAGNASGAAFIAMDHPDFYRTTLKNFATPWTNRDFDIFAPLNDYTATVIGIVRDDVDVREILTGSTIYVGDGSNGEPPWSPTDNEHYEALERAGADLADVLVARDQTSLTGVPADATAGVMTTRAGARAFFYAGTNRAMFRYTLVNHLCRDLEQVADTTLAPDRIRQDVTRAPGGDSRVFRNNCVGCHSGMDPLAQAFAYYSFEYDRDADPEGDRGRLVYNREGDIDPETGTRVVAKYHFNENNFPAGYVTPDDGWTNYWRTGGNRSLGWDPSLPGEGEGAKSMGRELANSEAFASCQVQKVFRAVCLRPPADAADAAQVQSMVASMKSSGYRLRQTFADAAVYCMGE